MKISSPELEQAFQAFQDIEDHRKTGTSSEALAAIVLDDPMYAREVKMPKYNGVVSMLEEPKVALKYANAWGIPTSKQAHAQRAEYFRGLTRIFADNNDDFLMRAIEEYGDGGGALISGIYREHFPADVKNRLRFLSHGLIQIRSAIRLHKYLSKTRSPLFK